MSLLNFSFKISTKLLLCSSDDFKGFFCVDPNNFTKLKEFNVF